MSVHEPTNPPGVEFLVISGPLTGKVIRGDFRPSEHGGVEHKKQTFGFIAKWRGHRYRVLCDVAFVGDPPRKLPGFALQHVKCESLTEGSPDLNADRFTAADFLEIGADGLLQSVDV